MTKQIDPTAAHFHLNHRLQQIQHAQILVTL